MDILNDKSKELFINCLNINITEDSEYVYIDRLKIEKGSETLTYFLTFVEIIDIEKLEYTELKIYQSIFNVLIEYGNSHIDKALLQLLFHKLSILDYNTVFAFACRLASVIISAPKNCQVGAMYNVDSYYNCNEYYIQYRKSLKLKTQYDNRIETIDIISNPVDLFGDNTSKKPIILDFADQAFVDSFFMNTLHFNAFKTLVFNNDFFEFGDRDIQKIFDVLIKLDVAYGDIKIYENE